MTGDEQTKQTKENTGEIKRLKEELAGAQASARRSGYLALWFALTAIMTLVASLLLAWQLNLRTERKFCDVVLSLDSPAPPTTSRGADTARKLRTLARKLDCPSPVISPSSIPSTYGPPPATTGRR